MLYYIVKSEFAKLYYYRLVKTNHVTLLLTVMIQKGKLKALNWADMISYWLIKSKDYTKFQFQKVKDLLLIQRAISKAMEYKSIPSTVTQMKVELVTLQMVLKNVIQLAAIVQHLAIQMVVQLANLISIQMAVELAY